MRLMTSAVAHQFTEAEYLALERASETKHEFLAGQIVNMAGARPPHNLLTANVTAALVSLARSGTCVVMTSDHGC